MAHPIDCDNDKSTAEQSRKLAKVWQSEIDEIISLSFRYTEEKRHRLRKNRKKLEDKKIAELDPATEASLMFSQSGRQRIENTRFFAEHMSIELHDKWQSRKSPLVDSVHLMRKGEENL